MRSVIIALLFIMFALTGKSQTQQNTPVIITTGVIVDGDTLPLIKLQEVRCWGRKRFRSKRAYQRYTKLVRNVKKTLPYARIAAERLQIIEDSLSRIPTQKMRDKYIKDSEKQLFAEFEKPLKHLTISQGRILIKLIDRETGNTSYQLIKTLKGNFSAFLWQGVARLFGSSLKSEYDAEGDDSDIEAIVNAIDAGAYVDY